MESMSAISLSDDILFNYKAALKEIKEKVEILLNDFILQNSTFDFIDIDRIKAGEKIMEKLHRKYPRQETFDCQFVKDNITDIAGLRVIFVPQEMTYNIEYLDKTLETLVDINYLKDMMRDASEIPENNDIDIIYRFLSVLKNGGLNVIEGKDKDYIASPKDTGYMSYHITVVASNGYPVEIQLRNLMQHLYAEAEHKRYKGTSDDEKNLVLRECVQYLSPEVNKRSL